jgi:hypothetical protein
MLLKNVAKETIIKIEIGNQSIYNYRIHIIKLIMLGRHNTMRFWQLGSLGTRVAIILGGISTTVSYKLNDLPKPSPKLTPQNPTIQ